MNIFWQQQSFQNFRPSPYLSRLCFNFDYTAQCLKTTTISRKLVHSFVLLEHIGFYGEV